MNWLISMLRPLLLFPVAAFAASGPMFDPALDPPDAEWCYAAQSTTVIGMPFVPEPVQVTYDGAIYTRHAELSFFYGKDCTPVMARNKTFKDGWMPIVEYGWAADGVQYHLKIFSALLPELGIENLAQFAKLSMTNPGASPVEGTVAAAMRGSGKSYRLGDPKEPVRPETSFAIENNTVTRDGKLIYTFSKEAALYAVQGKAYTKAYCAKDHDLSDRNATGYAVYKRILQPGETFSATFKMPRLPLDKPEAIAALKAADYQSTLDQTIAYWKSLFGDFSFEIPEPRVNDSYRAGLVHLMLATRMQNGEKRQGSGLPYDELFLNDYFDMLIAYDTAGLHQFHEPNVEWLLRKQHPSGMFIDFHNRGNDNIVTSHGQGLFTLAYHHILTGDNSYGKKVYPQIKKGVEFIIKDHEKDSHGLIRPSIPYDAPMVTGYHSCHNLYALLALRASIRVATLLGHADDAAAWIQAEKSYRKSILTAFASTFKKEGTITSGLYDWKPGFVQGKPENGANEYYNQDWENNLLVYPTELLAPTDEMLATTLATIRARKYREGVMTYRNGMHIHQYATVNMVNQYRAMGDQKRALMDMYHVLLHNGSTHEGFENLVVPWTNRTPEASCPPPHAWAAAKTALMIRNMLVCEYGGNAGIEPNNRNLFLYSLVSPSWIRPGKKVAMHNAPTEMGRVTSTLTFTGTGAEMTVQPQFTHAPRHIVFRIPYTVELDGYTANAKKSFEQDDCLFFSPDVTEVALKWHAKPGANDHNYQDMLKAYRSEYNEVIKDYNYDPARAGKPFLLDDEMDCPEEPLSFDLVRKAFSKEYSRRYQEYLNTGGKTYRVEAPKP
jgi:hypothetical protein